MPAVPAFCDACSAVFNSGFVVDNSYSITFSGCTSGPCPSCGGMGHVPDGFFNFIGDTIEILSAPERTVAELSRLAGIIEQAKLNNSNREAVAEAIRQETPGLSAIADLLPTNRGELYGFLALVLATAQLLSPLSSTTQNIQNVTVNQVVAQACPSSATPKLSKARQGRNEQCACGSGKKFKKCCGALN